MKQKPIYIMSLEASDIYYHNHRNMRIKREYHGMIPYSLESMKLINNGLKTTYIEDRDKYISNDIINVKFKTKVKSADDMIPLIKSRIEFSTNEKSIEEMLIFKEKLEEHSSNSESDDLWDAITVESLREKLYSDGFKIKFKNPRSNKEKEVEYVVYKRSSAKSRTGQCLFIKKSLYKRMINWSRMGIPFKNGQVIDLASLLAYESLVGSSLESAVIINPRNILIVDDVDSKFKQHANVVRKNENTGYLDSFEEVAWISNSLFDGESLLDYSYYEDGTSMMLLRNHMFKSAAFSCNIQDFLKDNCPTNIDYNTWEISNMFGEKMLAKNIHMITTPSSVKSLKFYKYIPSKSEQGMWNYWIEKVEEDGNIFGVCKHEKKSKIGIDNEGDIVQQTSYQMINCLPTTRNDIIELTVKEKQYIEDLQSNVDFLVQEIYLNRDVTNANEALTRLYKLNENIADTELFRKFKNKFIYKKKMHAKQGKIKIKGDYCVLLGNPMELLHHAIGKFDNNKPLELQNNEVHCTLYRDNEELIGFRNPNTSPSNVLIMRNKISNNIVKYFNLTNNIIVVNAIDFAIQDILSGCDYDSDTVLVSGEKKLVEIGKRCFGHYRVCINKIEGEKKTYRLTNNDHFVIDNQLSHSQRTIGRVVNLGQYCMSVYWDLVNNNISDINSSELLKKVDVMTILSGIAIDMAKKFYDIDMVREINNVSRNEELSKRNKKPNFWISVSQNKSIKNKIEHYDCPMDYLIEDIDNIKESPKTITIYLESLMNDFSTRHVNMRQIENVESVMNEYLTKLHEIKKLSSDESRNMHIELVNITINKLKKWRLKAETISILMKKMTNTNDRLLLSTIKMLYECHKEEFEKCYKIK